MMKAEAQSSCSLLENISGRITSHKSYQYMAMCAAIGGGEDLQLRDGSSTLVPSTGPVHRGWEHDRLEDEQKNNRERQYGKSDVP